MWRWRNQSLKNFFHYPDEGELFKVVLKFDSNSTVFSGKKFPEFEMTSQTLVEVLLFVQAITM